MKNTKLTKEAIELICNGRLTNGIKAFTEKESYIYCMEFKIKIDKELFNELVENFNKQFYLYTNLIFSDDIITNEIKENLGLKTKEGIERIKKECTEVFNNTNRYFIINDFKEKIITKENKKTSMILKNYFIKLGLLTSLLPILKGFDNWN